MAQKISSPWISIIFEILVAISALWRCCWAATELKAGGSGWALRFDGVNDFVLLEEDLPLEPWTIEMWVKPESLSNGDGTSLVTFNSKGTLLCRTSMVGGDKILQVGYNGQEVWYYSTSQYSIQTDEVSPTSAVGQPYHWALTKTQNASRVFINGVLASEIDLTAEDYSEISELVKSPWYLGARMVLLGQQWVTSDRNFGGVIDEVRWWSGERSEAELQKYMHRPVQHDVANLVKQWSFNKEDGDLVLGSYYLGGGNDFTAPSWIPSPFVSHGGSVAISTRSSAGASVVAVCAILTPAESGASAIFTLTGTSSLGALSPASIAMLETSEDTPSGSTRFCTNVTFVPSAAGFEEVAFEVKATLSDGITELSSTQNISILTTGNTPPSAGAALAVATDGSSNYLSLGSWEMADDWSMSLWVDPISYADDVWILSQHTSVGKNMFFLGFYGLGYRVRLSCFVGCIESITDGRNFPDVSGDVLVLESGRTADEIEIRKMEAHHLALTFHCVTRGDENTSALGIFKIYQDGLLIGHDEWPLCMHKPLLPEGYSDEDWQSRPVPWEMGAEYDGGTLDEHLEGVAVVPSGFMHAYFDELVVWNTTLSDAEVLSNAQGTLVLAADINVRYSFDLDDESDCEERQLWNKQLNCYGLNEANGTTAPSMAFPWTNALIGDVDREPSPFHLVPGSPVYKTLAAGTCTVATLQGADADGDTLAFSLVSASIDTSTQNLTLEGAYLTFCDGNPGLSVVQSLTVQYDACDPYGACASSTSALGKAIFYILPRGPSIKAFQALTKDRVLRIAFNEPTNCPTAAESADLEALFSLSDGSIAMRVGDWEEGCRILRITLENSSQLFTASAESLRVTVLYEGMLRDETEISYPSTDTSPTLVSLTCNDGELLLPGEIECTMCPSGSIPGENSITGKEECQACPTGTAGVGECSLCLVGRFANTTGLTECHVCPIGHSCGDMGMEFSEPCREGQYQSKVGQSSCTRCPRGQFSNTSGNTGCSSCPDGKTTDGTGFASLDDCECPANSYQYDDKCVSCGKGAVCDGFGAEPKAASGYQLFAVGSDKLDIFLCSRQTQRCPGGLVGTCAEGRTGIACSECLPNRTPNDDGSCGECEGGDLVIFVTISSALVIVMLCLYYRVSMYNTIRMKHEALLAVATAAQILFVMQVSAVLARLSIEWPEPLLSCYQFLLVFTFELEIFRMGCVMHVSELAKYLLKLAVMPIFVLSLTLCHLVVCCFRRISFYSQRHALLASLGVFVSSLYAALTSAISSPFQCMRHPNDRWSMKAAEGVICWEGGEHLTMIVFAVLALSMLFAFFAWVVRLIQAYPERMAAGDVRFLNTYAFLFLRVRPAARWYVVVFLARNGLIALMPAIPNAYWQAFAMIVAFGASFGTTLYVMPWKIPAANAFDIFTCAAFQANIVVAIPFIASSEDMTSLPEVALIASLVCFAASPLMLIRFFCVRASRSQKAYRWFLCHQKATAGAFARLLKLFLVEKFAYGVFLDSDDLVDLTKLFRYIECDTEMLVPLCTKELLVSPWCLGEIAVSTLRKIPITPVYFPDFEAPTNSFISEIGDFVALTVLTENSLSLEDVQAGLRNLRNQDSAHLPMDFKEATIKTVISALLSAEEATATNHTWRRNLLHGNGPPAVVHNLSSFNASMSVNSQEFTHAICLDYGQPEALAAGFVLLKMLRPLLSPHSGSLYILRMDRSDQSSSWSKMTEVAIVLCTSGCFSSARFLYGLTLLVQHEIELVCPVVAANDFVFPNSAFYEELEARVAQICSDAGVQEMRALLTPFTRHLFQKIFSRFSILDSRTILETQADIIAQRLSSNLALNMEYFTEEAMASKPILSEIISELQGSKSNPVTAEAEAKLAVHHIAIATSTLGNVTVAANGAETESKPPSDDQTERGGAPLPEPNPLQMSL